MCVDHQGMLALEKIDTSIAIELELKRDPLLFQNYAQWLEGYLNQVIHGTVRHQFSNSL